MNYTVLLSQLDGNKCSREGLNLDEQSRAKKVVKDAEGLGVPKFMRG